MNQARKTAGDELAEQLQAIMDGTLQGPDAAAVLRAAVIHCHEGEEAVEALRKVIADAEVILAYGQAGKPARQYPSAFGSNSRG